MPTLATEIADFVRQARQAAAEAKPRVYLAIGTFQDLSVNDRQIGFATQLQGYLTAAFQHSLPKDCSIRVTTMLANSTSWLTNANRGL